MAPADRQDRDLRTSFVSRGRPFTVEADGREVCAYDGESVLGVLWAAGIGTLHVTAQSQEPRGFFCGMGVCFDCLVTIDGRVNIRACLEPVRPGMRISTQRDAGSEARGGRD